MAQAKVTPQGYSPADERFAYLVATGEMNQQQAYRATHPDSQDSPASTVDPAASHLASKLRPRIQEIAAQLQLAAVQDAAWDKVRLINAAAENLHGSRAANQWGSANGALELIGRVTGLLNDKAHEQGSMVTVTKVTIILDRGTGAAPGQQVVETTSRALPQAQDTDDKLHDVTGDMAP